MNQRHFGNLLRQGVTAAAWTLIAATAFADIGPDIPPLKVSLRTAWVIVAASCVVSLMAGFFVWRLIVRRRTLEGVATQPGGCRWFADIGVVLFVGVLVMGAAPFIGLPIYLIGAEGVTAIGLAVVVFFWQMSRPRGTADTGMMRQLWWRELMWVAVAVLFVVIGLTALSTISEADRERSRHRQPNYVRSAMGDLKTALTQFRDDVGRYPHVGVDETPESIVEGCRVLLGSTAATNILTNPEATGPGVASPPMGVTRLKQRWRGPYMETPPEDFMRDANGNPYVMGCASNTVYLRSAGYDHVLDPLADCLGEGYRGDDVVITFFKPRGSSVLPVSGP